VTTTDCGMHPPMLDCANGHQEENQKTSCEVEENHQQEGDEKGKASQAGEEEACCQKVNEEGR